MASKKAIKARGRAASAKQEVPARRARVSQQDVPAYPLKEALRVAHAILENYGNGPATPLQTAQGLSLQPTSSTFRMITGASIAYGLTTGGYNADQISVEQLAKRILRPTAEGDDLAAKREAVLRPKVIRAFLTKYNGSSLPRTDIARNVLGEMGVPPERVDDVYALIRDSATDVGFIRKINDREYVDLAGTAIVEKLREDDAETSEDDLGDDIGIARPVTIPTALPPPATPNERDPRLRRVFITHGKNRGFIEPLKKLLAFGELEAVVSVERQTVAQAMPEKVKGDMRSCGAAVIHVDDELRLVDADANEHIVLNPNVLIEIGAAMALYDKRFILLVKEGVKLPSNLQGLAIVWYAGDTLSGDATIKLLEAINDIKNHALPPAV